MLTNFLMKRLLLGSLSGFQDRNNSVHVTIEMLRGSIRKFRHNGARFYDNGQS